MKECPRCQTCFDDQADVCPDDRVPLRAAIPGSRLIDGKYQLERCLGRGGMGVVYRARHLGLQRAVAVKLIAADAAAGSDFADRFRLEAAALGRLKHPHIVDVTDFGVETARAIPYLVMELLEGISLADRLTAGRLDRRDAIGILESIAAAVDVAHSRGILHRDLKPANVFLVDRSVKIVDFGLAQFLEGGGRQASPGATTSSRVTAAADVTGPVAAGDPASIHDVHDAFLDVQRRDAGFVMGTHEYLAPELLRFQPATPASDLYVVGVMAYQLLTGAVPPPADPIRPPSTVDEQAPPELDAPVLAMLAEDPAARPKTATAAVRALRQGEQRAAAREWFARERPRRRRAAVLIAGTVAVSAVLLWRVPALQRLEARSVDVRFAAAPRRVPDPRLLLLTIDDKSLEADPRALALRADEIATIVTRVLDAGARAVGIDLLLPRAWASSGAFAHAIARYPERLTLAAFSDVSGRVLGPECVPGLAVQLLGAERVSRLFGYVNVEADDDRVTRRLMLAYRDTDGRLRPAWASRIARGEGSVEGKAWLDFSLDRDAFQRIAWRNVSAALESEPARFRDALVLVGGEFAASGDEAHLIPDGVTSPALVSGLLLQALAVNTILDGLPIRQAPIWPWVLASATAAAMGAFALLVRPAWRGTLAAALAGVTAYAAVCLAIFAAWHVILPIAGPIVSIALGFALALTLRRRWGSAPQVK